MGAALPADPTVIGWPVTRLPHLWIEAEIADQLLWRGEASDVANGCEHTERNDRVDAPNRHQSFHSFVTQSVFGEALFVSGELDGDAIVLIKMATNKPPLILRKWLSVEPSPAALAEQLAGISAESGLRARRFSTIRRRFGAAAAATASARRRTSRQGEIPYRQG